MAAGVPRPDGIRRHFGAPRRSPKSARTHIGAPRDHGPWPSGVSPAVVSHADVTLWKFRSLAACYMAPGTLPSSSFGRPQEAPDGPPVAAGWCQKHLEQDAPQHKDQCGPESSDRGGIRPAKMLDVDHQSIGEIAGPTTAAVSGHIPLQLNFICRNTPLPGCRVPSLTAPSPASLSGPAPARGRSESSGLTHSPVSATDGSICDVLAVWRVVPQPSSRTEKCAF